MKSLHINVLVVSLGLALSAAGCQDHTSPPPPHVQSPPVGQDTPRPQMEQPKPLPSGSVLPGNQPAPQPPPPSEDVRTPVR